MAKKTILKYSILTGAAFLMTVISSVATGITSNYEQVINIALNGVSSKVVTPKDDTTNTNYFTLKHETLEEHKAADRVVAERLTEEGCVLLKNENNALPIKTSADVKARVSIFGHSSVNTIACGTGSADIDTTGETDFKTAFEKRNVVVNEALWNFYTNTLENGLDGNKYETNPKKGDQSIRNGADGVSKGAYTVNEIPWDKYPSEVTSSFANHNDAAIVVLSRLGGEMWDLPANADNQGNTNESSNGNSLEITFQEKAMIKGIKDSGKFDKIIVLINSANAMEVDFVDDPELGIDSCMWIGYTGLVGLDGVADLLLGNSNPSGRLPDTYCLDNTTAPSSVNLYSSMWDNVEYDPTTAKYYITDESGNRKADKKLFDLALDSNVWYNVYQEGIYVGYRYYETRYEDAVLNRGNHGNYDYAKDVKYPFGYGISYTTFSYSNFELEKPTTLTQDSKFTINVTVTNTGNTAGKEVVQVYLQQPYTQYDIENGVEKSAIELCGFAKTDVLEPGASEEVTIEVEAKELRSYDANGAKTYILDAGDYHLAVGRNAHDALNNVLAAKGADVSRMIGTGDSSLVGTWNNPTLDTEVFSVSNDGEENYEITNQFDNGDLNKVDNGKQPINYLSRNDWVGTYPTESFKVNLSSYLYNNLTGIKEYTAKETNEEMPTMGKKGDVTLAQLMGKDYNDPLWEELLDQIRYDEMAKLIGVGYHGTQAVNSVAKPATKDENGPQGFTAKLSDVFGTQESICAYTDENIMAATFNVELMKEVGECIGEDGLRSGMSGLYGPAMNTHRSPYGGRNFEYYSEDGFLAGKIAAAEVIGIQSRGVYTYIKHFALNDIESHCRCYSIFVNEQAVREIYMQPFEHAIIDGGAYNVMNSFARVGVEWVGSHVGMMTNVLRKEWGMRGFALTDYSNTGKTFDVRYGVLGGTDSWDCSSSQPGSWYDILLQWEKQDDVELVKAMRESTHRILYTVVHSNAMNGLSPKSKIIHVTPWWQGVLIGLIVVSALGTIVSGTFLSLNLLKIKKAKNEEAK